MQNVGQPQKKKSRVRKRTRNKVKRVSANEKDNDYRMGMSKITVDPVTAGTTCVEASNQSKKEKESNKVIHLHQKFMGNKIVNIFENTNETELNTQQKNTEHKNLENVFKIPLNKLNSCSRGIFKQTSVSEIESSTDDDDNKNMEFFYKPREYFLVSLCNFCKIDLSQRQWFPCTRCGLSYYCSKEHINRDQVHYKFCHAICQVTENIGSHIFNMCCRFTPEQFRSYRILIIKKVESVINRSLTPAEQEVILFPRICNYIDCRENRFQRLKDCILCGQEAFCKNNPAHFSKHHKNWCSSYQLFKDLTKFKYKFEQLESLLPYKISKKIPLNSCNTKQIFDTLQVDVGSNCEYAVLSQLSTGPLTAWFALKMTNRLKCFSEITIHLIGAEIEFEIDVLHKWELFLLHITPKINKLNVIFIGPEINTRKISFEELKKTKCCQNCRKTNRSTCYYFKCEVYHRYCKTANFLTPQLVCFFNPGLYRSTGFAQENTWPETIRNATYMNCPIIVTSYTKYEAHLDMTRLIREANRELTVILPPTVNPFASGKPERNFISDDSTPIIFKNFYAFIVE